MVNLKLDVPNEITAEYSWSTDYAIYVHEGVTFTKTVRFPTKDGSWVTIEAGTEYPARRWTEYALANFEFNSVFAALLERYGDPVKAFTDAAYLLGAEFTKAISDPVWDWRDGKRDIVDTGQLRASQTMEITT